MLKQESIVNYCIIWLIITILTVITTNCGYHLRYKNKLQTPNKIKNIIFTSYDPYGLLTRAIKTELRLNDIMWIHDNIPNSENEFPLLNIINSLENYSTISVFNNGKTAEYQITMNVQAQVILPRQQGNYPINIRVYRFFFDNPTTALAKDNEKDIIRQEMYQQAAQQIVNKLLILNINEQ